MVKVQLMVAVIEKQPWVGEYPSYCSFVKSIEMPFPPFFGLKIGWEELPEPIDSIKSIEWDCEHRCYLVDLEEDQWTRGEAGTEYAEMPTWEEEVTAFMEDWGWLELEQARKDGKCYF